LALALALFGAIERPPEFITKSAHKKAGQLKTPLVLKVRSPISVFYSDSTLYSIVHYEKQGQTTTWVRLT